MTNDECLRPSSFVLPSFVKAQKRSVCPCTVYQLGAP